MVRCWKCEQKHQAALDVLAGNPPKACGKCCLTFEELAARTQGAEVSMFLHWKDGIYQVLCRACSDLYVSQRKDLYGPTPFGRERGLS